MNPATQLWFIRGDTKPPSQGGRRVHAYPAATYLTDLGESRGSSGCMRTIKALPPLLGRNVQHIYTAAVVVLLYDRLLRARDWQAAYWRCALPQERNDAGGRLSHSCIVCLDKCMCLAEEWARSIARVALEAARLAK